MFALLNFILSNYINFTNYVNAFILYYSVISYVFVPPPPHYFKC